MTAARKNASQKPLPPSESVDQFLDLAGHELRTPITALKGHVQLLQRRLRRDPGRAADLAELGKMMYQIERMNHELDVYLDTAHITRNRFDLSPMPCDIVALARRLVEIYAAGTTGHDIQLESAEERIEGNWDRKRLEIALSALLTNALKFSRDGEVAVRLAREGDAVRVEVSDRGVGVPPAERHRIFAAYTHASNVENSGAGLGLYVAREAVRRQGGRIGVRANPGGGSIFWLTLPLRATCNTSHRTAR